MNIVYNVANIQSLVKQKYAYIYYKINMCCDRNKNITTEKYLNFCFQINTNMIGRAAHCSALMELILPVKARWEPGHKRGTD